MDGKGIIRPLVASLMAALSVAGCGGSGDAAQGSLVAPAVNASSRWTLPVELETASGKAEYPSSAMAANGDVITVFAQRMGDRTVVHAVHGNIDAQRYGAPRVIDHASTSAQAPALFTGKSQSATQVAMNPATGDAVAVWSALSGGVAHVWSARYVKASDAWSAPVQLDTAANGASYPVVAMNAQGNAVAAWSEAATSGAPRGVVVATLANGSWRQPVRVSTRATGDLPQVGIDAAGSAVAAWVEQDAQGTVSAEDLVAARIGSNGTVADSRVIDASATPAKMPALAVAPNGNALLAWLQSDGSNTSVFASYLAGSAWSAAERIENLPNESFAPAVALNDTAGFVAWEQEESAGFSGHAYVARRNANRWEEPVRVYNRGGYMPVVRVQDNGDAMMIWLAAHTQYARFSASSARWSEVTNLSPYNCGNGHTFAMDSASGKSFAAWIPSACGRHEDVYGSFFR